jgi:2'-5' RNA ligase
MRLFIAVKLNDEVKDFLAEAIQKLKAYASGGRFTHRENLHLTLVFLGEVSEEKLVAVKSAMDRVSGKSFRLSVKGFGRFKRRGGDIHWAGIVGNDALLSLQKQLNIELKTEGFASEEREFSPHLTLGREIRIPDTSSNLYGPLTGEEHEMAVTKISLMKSERIGGRLVYTEIYQKELA